MNKRLLTLEDLYSYYSSKSRSSHYSAKDEDKNIVVQVPGKIEFSQNDYSEGLLPVHLQACHTLDNLNKTYISEETMQNALPSFMNRPILGYIHEVNGQLEFYSHNMHQDENGEIVYDEIPVGIIPESNNAVIKFDEEKQHSYVEVDGYIFEEYTKAAEILEREGELACSCELSIREMSFNAKEKLLNLDNFYFAGLTILGKDPDGNEVKPGMEGSNIKLADFTAKKNSVFSQEDLIARLEELESKFESFSINNKPGKEDDGENMTKFEELLQQYEKSIEDVTFEYEGLTDEELEAKFAEVFDQEEPEGDPELDPEPEPDGDPEPEAEEPESDPEPEGEEKFSKTFELSHDDIRCALYALVSEYEEMDNEWYGITEVYDDHFVFCGFFGGKYWGQNYSKDGDNVSLNGERWELFAELLTATEKAALDSMRSNYAELEAKAVELAKYEAEPEKMNLLNSSDYAYVVDTEEFSELKKQESHFDLSVDEVKARADEILINYAKAGAINVNNGQNSVGHVAFAKSQPKKAGRYGDIFSRK